MNDSKASGPIGTIGKQIFSGVLWSSIQIAINKSFAFIIKLILARILFPEDYGIVGMAVVFTSIIQVFNDLGMGAALVQRKEEDLTDDHFQTAFWTGIFWSVGLYLLISFGVGPLASWFYNEPMLEKILPALSIGVLATPINSVHVAHLTRDLNFKKLAMISNSSNFFSGVLSLILAFLGAGVWALVFNSVASLVVAMPLYFKTSSWRPKYRWSKKCFEDIFGFGVYTTGTQLFNKITSQVDYLLIGKLLGASSLGVYAFAFVLTDTFRGQMMTIINKVMYPVYAKTQKDKEKLKHYYLQVVMYNALIVYPFMVFLLIFSDQVVPMLFGDKWQAAIPVIQILSISVMIHMLINSNTSLIRGYGKVKVELVLQIVKTLLFFIPLITIGTIYFGILGTATGYTVAKVLAVILSMVVTKRLFSLKIRSILLAASKPLAISGLAGGLAYGALSLGTPYYFAILIYMVAILGLTLAIAKKEILGLTKFLSRKSPKVELTANESR